MMLIFRVVYVSFPIEGEEYSLVAWTTTPWTLPSNLALCVNPDMEYVHFYGISLFGKFQSKGTYL